MQGLHAAQNLTKENKSISSSETKRILNQYGFSWHLITTTTSAKENK